ncbi:MAG: Ig-like domain-containing protein [Acidobacteriota bacterium]
MGRSAASSESVASSGPSPIAPGTSRRYLRWLGAAVLAPVLATCSSTHAVCGIEPSGLRDPGVKETAPGADSTIEIRFEDDSAHPTFKVVGLDEARLARYESANFPPDIWQQLFAVFVIADSFSDGSEVPPILGSYGIREGALVFRARFPLEPGLRYRAVFNPLMLPGADKTVAGEATKSSIIATFEIPKPESAPSTIVEQVYPSTNLLPENQLKFYLHFSAPMSRGEAYRRIRLLDESARQVDLPFLELDEELWDREGKRLTIFFDPGRIKRGLVPHEEVGVPIEEGKRYSLVVDRDWPDAQGNPLKKGFRKSFRVGPPDREPLDPKSWRLSRPTAGSLDPLAVEFPEPIDYALLLRLLEVTEPAGNLVQGSVQVDSEETRWRFTPLQPWKAGDYLLTVATILEDLAGNTINRPFEANVLERVEERISRETIRLPFKIVTDDCN